MIPNSINRTSSTLAGDLCITSISEPEDFFLIRTDWEKLLDKSEIHSLFLSHGWLECFWNVWGNDKQLIVLSAHQGSHLVGAAPLMLYNGKHLGLPVRILSFIENDESPHCGLLVDREAETEAVVWSFLTQITSNTKRWDMLSLRKIPDEAGIVDCIKTYCQKNRYRFIVRPSLDSPILNIDSDWTSFYSRKSQRFKKRIRNDLNRLKRLGDITVRESHSPQEVTSLLRKVFEVGAHSWKGNMGKAIGSTPQNRTFFSRLPYYIAAQGSVSLWSLFLMNRMIAFEYHIKQGDVVYALRGEFDEDYRNYSPGAVLEFEVVRRLFQDKLRLYNMCGSQEEYKLRWTHDYQSHSDLLIFNRRPYSVFLAFLEKNVKRTIKNTLRRKKTSSFRT